MMEGFTRRWRAAQPWPAPRRGPHYSVCHFCDTLHDADRIPEGEAARCARCNAPLYQNRYASLTRASAFSVAALVAIALMHVFPLLIMDAAGIRRSLTLSGAAFALIEEQAPILGCFVILFTIVAPLFLALSMLYITFPLLFGVAAPGAKTVARWMYVSEPWNMAEVFLLGVVVSLLKLVKVADVQFGVGFFACAGVMVFLAAAVAGIDREELWDRLEVATE